MEKIAKELPDLKAVETKFETVLENSLNDFIATTNSRREEVIGSRRYTLVSLIFSITIIFALYVLYSNGKTQLNNILIGFSMLWLTVVYVSGRSWLTNDRLLAKEINLALVPALTNTLNRMILYVNNQDHRDETKDLLIKSKLITSSDITVISDDMYTLYGDKDVSLRELLVSQKRQNGNGKGSSQVTIFKGLFVTTKLSKVQTVPTYISTDGDKLGFAHLDFWSALLSNNEVKETTFEWNDFEKNLHVATSDPVAAREILTPDFMLVLHEWWLEHKLNIRIVFKDDFMYMLSPEDTIKIDTSTTSTKLPVIKKYAWSLIRPMWRAINLVENIKS
jgi:Protein of unknown function (DUF3137)